MHSISHQLHSKMSFWGDGGCSKEIIGSDWAKRHKHHKRVQRYDDSCQCNTLSAAPNRPTNVYIWIMEKKRIYEFPIFFLKLLYALTLYIVFICITMKASVPGMETHSVEHHYHSRHWHLGGIRVKMYYTADKWEAHKLALASLECRRHTTVDKEKRA